MKFFRYFVIFLSVPFIVKAKVNTKQTKHHNVAHTHKISMPTKPNYKTKQQNKHTYKKPNHKTNKKHITHSKRVINSYKKIIKAQPTKNPFEFDKIYNHFSIGFNVGSSMLGAELTYKVNNYLEPRLYGNFFQYSVKNHSIVNKFVKTSLEDKFGLITGTVPNQTFTPITVKDLKVDSKATAKFFNAGITMDFHPFKNGFFISSGFGYNKTSVNLKINGSSLKGTALNGANTVNLSNSQMNFTSQPFNVSNMGNFQANIKWNEFTPYLGIGFRGNFSEANLGNGKINGFNASFLENLGIIAEVGVFYFGKPQVEITAPNNTVLNSVRIKKIQEEVNKKVDKYLKYAAFWPVAKIGLSYRF